MFALSKSFYLNAVIRFFIGFFQVFICIYMPVWADSFANEKQKSIWLTFLILACPLGVVIGFSLTSLMVAEPFEDWRYSFYAQAALMAPCALCFLLTPAKYLNISNTIVVRAKCAHTVQQKLYKVFN